MRENWVDKPGVSRACSQKLVPCTKQQCFWDPLLFLLPRKHPAQMYTKKLVPGTDMRIVAGTAGTPGTPEEPA